MISYEEYHPYGTTAFQLHSSEVSRKRYRYTGMERDEETGLNYHSARYYALWLGRWCSCDPEYLIDGANLYLYCQVNPVIKNDLEGKSGRSPLTSFEKSWFMHIAIPFLSVKSHGNRAVSLRRRILLLARAREESLGHSQVIKSGEIFYKKPEGYNIFNIQVSSSTEIGVGSQGIKPRWRMEWLPLREEVTAEKEKELIATDPRHYQYNEKGELRQYRRIRTNIPLYSSIQEATRVQLEYLKERYPGAYSALVNSNETDLAFYNGLKGYGTNKHFQTGQALMQHEASIVKRIYEIIALYVAERTPELERELKSEIDRYNYAVQQLSEHQANKEENADPELLCNEDEIAFLTSEVEESTKRIAQLKTEERVLQELSTLANQNQKP